jgi:protein gp37
MADNTGIEWADATWNPILGCSKVSEGCRNCYAIRSVRRMSGNPNPKIQAATRDLVMARPDGSLNWTGNINFIADRLDQPTRWAKPRKIFVNSQSDLFHEKLHGEQIAQVFAVMAACRRHTFQVLTKRPDRMAEMLADTAFKYELDAWLQRKYLPGRDWVYPLPNVWLGASVEDQTAADARIPHLVRLRGWRIFLSMEPLLGPVRLTDVRFDEHTRMDVLSGSGLTTRPGAMGQTVPNCFCEPIDWVIVGGESGPGARPMNPEWARSIRDECVRAGAAFFFKQWGSNVYPSQAPEDLYRDLDAQFNLAGIPDQPYTVDKHRAGRLLDGVEWSQFPTEDEPA